MHPHRLEQLQGPAQLFLALTDSAAGLQREAVVAKRTSHVRPRLNLLEDGYPSKSALMTSQSRSAILARAIARCRRICPSLSRSPISRGPPAWGSRSSLGRIEEYERPLEERNLVLVRHTGNTKVCSSPLLSLSTLPRPSGRSLSQGAGTMVSWLANPSLTSPACMRSSQRSATTWTTSSTTRRSATSTRTRPTAPSSSSTPPTGDGARATPQPRRCRCVSSLATVRGSTGSAFSSHTPRQTSTRRSPPRTTSCAAGRPAPTNGTTRSRRRSDRPSSALADEFAAFEQLLDVAAKTGADDVRLVPDTGALIRNPDLASWARTAPCPTFVVHLLPTVLGELDELKDRAKSQELREQAQSVVRRLKGLRDKGSLAAGVNVTKAITVTAEAREADVRGVLEWLDASVPDDRIVAAALRLQSDHPGGYVVLVTSDLNLQNKADAVGLPYMETPPPPASLRAGLDAVLESPSADGPANITLKNSGPATARHVRYSVETPPEASPPHFRAGPWQVDRLRPGESDRQVVFGVFPDAVNVVAAWTDDEGTRDLSWTIPFPERPPRPQRQAHPLASPGSYSSSTSCPGRRPRTGARRRVRRPHYSRLGHTRTGNPATTVT